MPGAKRADPCKLVDCRKHSEQALVVGLVGQVVVIPTLAVEWVLLNVKVTDSREVQCGSS